MNPLLNYASFEASKKLFEAGIVLETEFYWVEREDWSHTNLDGSSKNVMTIDAKDNCDEFAIPAPNFGDVWRESPGDIFIDKKRYRLDMWKVDDELRCCYVSQNACFATDPKSNENVTDALIELLIWVRKVEKK
jgi:hypothetical protein